MRAVLLVLCATLAAAAGASDRFAYEIELQRSDAGTYYLPGGLGFGIETELLVDTGSSYVVLSADTFRKLRAHANPLHVRDIQGAMASGRPLRASIYQLDMLMLGDRCILRDVEVAVIPGATRDILGLNGLRQLQPFLISLDPPRLRVAQCIAVGTPQPARTISAPHAS